MRIDPKIFTRMSHVGQRYAKFQKLFGGFAEAAHELAESDSRVTGITFEPPTCQGILDVLFAGFCMRFQLLVCYDENGTTRGRVLCTRALQGRQDDGDLLGHFTFDSQGVTDFEVPAGADLLELDLDASKIVLHFLDLAIETQLGPAIP